MLPPARLHLLEVPYHRLTILGTKHPGFKYLGLWGTFLIQATTPFHQLDSSVISFVEYAVTLYVFPYTSLCGNMSKTRSHVLHADLKFDMFLRMTLKSWPFCFHVQSTRITGVYYHAKFMWCEDTEPRISRMPCNHISMNWSTSPVLNICFVPRG